MYEVLLPNGSYGLTEDHVAVPPQVRSVDVKKRIIGDVIATLESSVMAQLGLGRRSPERWGN